MELLSNLFGNLALGVIRLAVAVGIIAATYFFLVKPVLSTADNAIKSFDATGLGNIGRQIDHAIDSANGQVRRKVRRSFHRSTAFDRSDQRGLLRCVRRANGNVKRLQTCAGMF